MQQPVLKLSDQNSSLSQVNPMMNELLQSLC